MSRFLTKIRRLGATCFAALRLARPLLLADVRRRGPEIQSLHARASEIEALGREFWHAGQFEDCIEAFKLATRIRQDIAQRLSLESIAIIPKACAEGIGCMGYIDTYIKAKMLEGSSRTLVLLSPPERIVNRFFLDLFADHLIIVTNPRVLRHFEPLAKLIAMPLDWVMPWQGDIHYIHSVEILVQRRWEADRRYPLLDRNRIVREHGAGCLEKLGIKPEIEHVCLHVRESGFHGEGEKSQDAYRNADVGTYRAAIEEITHRGLYVVRMGDPSMRPLPPIPNVIDYAHSAERSDLMDVTLIASCRFYVGTLSGLYKVATALQVPTAVTNVLPMSCLTFNGQDVVLPKKIISATLGRELTVSEMFANPVSTFYLQNLYDLNELSVLENSEEQLRFLITDLLDASQTGRGRAIPSEGSGAEDRFMMSGKLSPRFLSEVPIDGTPVDGGVPLRLPPVDPNPVTKFARHACAAKDLNLALQLLNKAMAISRVKLGRTVPSACERPATRFVVTIPVWGEQYVKRFLEISLPTHFFRGNLEVFSDGQIETTYLIYTCSQDAKSIADHVAIGRLREFVDVELVCFDFPPDFWKTNKYGVMNLCNQHALIRANQNAEPCIYLAADTFLGENVFATIIGKWRDGYRACLAPITRLCEEEFIPKIAGRVSGSIENRELVAIGLSCLDPAILPMFVESDRYIVNPSIVYSRVGRHGLLSRQFHLHPFMVRPSKPHVLPVDTIDSLYLDAAVDDLSEVYVVEDSDEMVAFCMDSIKSYQPENALLLAGKSRIEITAEWAGHNTTAFHRKFFERKCRIHSRALDDEWRHAEAQSDEFVANVLGIVQRMPAKSVADPS